MAHTTPNHTQTKHHFKSVSEAILALKKGKKDDRWYDAAQFLIDRATPEVKLMLEVGQAMALRNLTTSSPKKVLSLKDWILYGGLIILMTAGVIWVGLKLVLMARSCA